MRIKILAPINPLPFKRVMQSGKRRFNCAEYTEFKTELGFSALKAMRGQETLKGAIKIKADFYKPKPKPTSRNWGDIDNHLKAVLDSLNGVSFIDDSQVVEVRATKNIGEPHIVIELEEL